MTETEFLQLISRPPETLADRVMCGMLRGVSWLYGAGAGLKNLSFDRGWRTPQRVTPRVISVGNLTTGGTGKTPVVALLVHTLQQFGLAPGIVSRGYRSLPGQGNDERLVLERLCPGVLHEQHADRLQAIAALGPVDVVVADDAFQHRRLARDLDIVLIDALNPWGHGALLPRGLLRESVCSLRRAGLVLLTRADQIDAPARSALIDRVRDWNRDVSVLEVAFVPSGFIDQAGQTLSELPAEPVFGFCGIGNPQSFRRTLEACHLTVAGLRNFPDHHHYSDRDLDQLMDAGRQAGARRLVTTLKDLVKLDSQRPGLLPVTAIGIEARLLTGADEFLAAVRRAAIQSD